MKYRIEGGEGQSLTLRLTPSGRLREFVGGMLTGLPWGLIGLSLFFLPDYLGNYRHKPAVEPWFWWSVASMLVVVVLFWGIKRAFGTRWWDFNSEGLRQHTRSLFGAPGLGLEVPARAVTDVVMSETGRRVSLKTASGAEVLIARTWWKKDELREVKARVGAWLDGSA